MARKPTYDELSRKVRLLEKTVAQGNEREKRHQEDEKRSQIVIDSLPFDVFGLATSGRYNIQNLACQDHWGDILGKRPNELGVHKQTLEIWEKNNQSAFAGNVVKDEVAFENKGEKRFFYNIIMPHRDNKTIKGILGINIDITEVKRAEEALRLSERKYRDLVENANSIIFRMDAAGHITFFNEFAQEFLGFEEEEIIGKNVIGTIVPETESTGRDLVDLIQDIARNPSQYYNNENENMKKNGERVWVSWTNKPVYDDDGRVVETLCIGNDITPHKQAEDALQKSEKRYRDLVDNANSIIVHWDGDGNIVFMNPYGLAFFGYKEEELIGRNVVGTVVPETESTTERDLDLLMKDIQNEPDKFLHNENENM
jgi:PAS domain S-box-containing protein